MNSSARKGRRLLTGLLLASAILSSGVGWAETSTADDFRARPPTAGPAKPVSGPPVQQFRLDNGLRVALIERRTLPTLQLELTWAGGAQHDPSGQEGRAGVCMALVSEGTAQLDKVAYEEALADIAAHLQTWATVDQRGASLSVLTRHADRALDLLADTLLRPGLRQADFDRLVAQRKAGLQAMRANPAALAGRLQKSVAYGAAHPAGRVATEASYGALTLADCQADAKHLLPDGAQLWVVGAIDRKTLTRQLQARLGGWRGRAAEVALTGPPQLRQGRVFAVDVPGAPQAVVQLVHPGPRLTEPGPWQPDEVRATVADYEATHVLSAILASGFSSRINMNIREKHGYAYGAGGGFQYTRDAGVFVVQASVRTDVAGPSIREMLREMAAIREAPVTADELDREKQGAVLALPAKWATGKSILGTYQTLAYFGQGLTALGDFARRVPKVTADEVLAAARAHVQPEAVQVLVVGDWAKVLPQLEALQKDGVLPGPIVRLDADGKPVP
jgi:zinc protease